MNFCSCQSLQVSQYKIHTAYHMILFHFALIHTEPSQLCLTSFIISPYYADPNWLTLFSHKRYCSFFSPHLPYITSNFWKILYSSDHVTHEYTTSQLFHNCHWYQDTLKLFNFSCKSLYGLFPDYSLISNSISLHFSWNSYSSLNAPCYLCLWVFSHADFCWSNAIIPTLQLYSFPRCQLMYSVIREALMRAQVLSKISEHQTTIIKLILIGSIYRCEYGFIL